MPLEIYKTFKCGCGGSYYIEFTDNRRHPATLKSCSRKITRSVPISRHTRANACTRTPSMIYKRGRSIDDFLQSQDGAHLSDTHDMSTKISQESWRLVVVLFISNSDRGYPEKLVLVVPL